jgi:hypothetical protein
MTDREKQLIIALVWMVEQYLWMYDEVIDTSAMAAGQKAIEALACFGLVEVVDTRFGRWTEAGLQFRREAAEIRDNELVDQSGGTQVGKQEPES